MAFIFKKPSLFSISISSVSKDKPSPLAKSAKPPRSAKDSNWIIPGALITLKLSKLALYNILWIFNLD